MKCLKCGKTIIRGKLFCESCDIGKPEEKDKNHIPVRGGIDRWCCPSCGTFNYGKDRICNNCGWQK